MKHLVLFYFLLMLTLACNQKSSDQAKDQTTNPSTISEETPEPQSEEEPRGFEVRDPTDEEINEFGLIATMEDAGYPMFTVTISFPERNTSSDFSLNAEAALLSHEIGAYKDNYATIYYEANESNEVLDMLFNGQSLLGEYAPEDHEGLESFEGILKGATKESGDLPDPLSIEGVNGTLNFKYFVDAETMAANDQQVTVYYYTRYTSEITYMELSVD